MANRLQELLQQRALIKEHLEWLDAEIASASGETASERTEPPTPLFAPLLPPGPHFVSTAPQPTGDAREADEADALIAELAASEKATSLPTKKGCWIVFSVGLSLTVIAAWLLLHFFYRG